MRLEDISLNRVIGVFKTSDEENTLQEIFGPIQQHTFELKP
jgi:hypothetical protein